MNIKIAMSEKEWKKILSYLKPNDIMLEWGSGGSTHLFSKCVKEYYSIENNEKWYNKTIELLEDPIFPRNIKLILVKNNAPRTKPTKRFQFKDYIEVVHHLDVEKFDKVLIDGRGRQWCAIEVLPYLKDDSLVFIHDYFPRVRYWGVMKYYDEVDRIEKGRSLIILKKK